YIGNLNIMKILLRPLYEKSKTNVPSFKIIKSETMKIVEKNTITNVNIGNLYVLFLGSKTFTLYLFYNCKTKST
ncbi:hypothetical protein, partial [Vibrio cholerae]|uniref:hypothetical protein n=1 Tax=Vibrio cholerae TaxID=666 RepID=UPI001C8DCC93